VKSMLHRKWLVGVAAAGLVMGPLAAVGIVSIGAAGATVGTDAIQYVQPTNGTNTGYAFSYIPGDGSPATSQPLTLSGTQDGDNDGDDCATPTYSGSPFLTLTGLYFNHLVNGAPYTGTPTTVRVGAYNGMTGVCATTWSSSPTSISQNQSLTFGVGTNALVTGRSLQEAQIQLKRATRGGDGYRDDGDSDDVVTGQLIERSGATIVGTQSFMIPGGTNPSVTIDTGVISGGFSSVEVRVTSCPNGGGVSVVGPASTFSFVQLPQTISFTNTPPASPAVGSTYTVTATASSGLPVGFSVDSTSTSGCTVDASTGLVTLGAPAGSCVIDANQPGNARYLPAPQVQQTVNSVKLPQSITFTNTPPSSPSVNDSYTVSATASSGLAVVFSVDAASTSGCVVDANTGVVTLDGPAGTCVIDANQPGNAVYFAAPQVQQATGVNLATQTVSFTSTPPTAPNVGDTYQASATSSSGLAVTFSIDPSSTSGCTVDPSTGLVTFSAPAGTCVIDATQSGNTSYAPGSAQQSTTEYVVICGQQTITAASTDGTAQSGQISATLTFKDYNGQPAPTNVCKQYQSFTATTNDPVPSIGGVQSVDFASTPLPTAHVVATIVWAVQGFCTPDGSNNSTKCPPTYVSLDGGTTWQPQTFCTSAQQAGLAWCTTSKSYAYVNGGTQITENWDGYGDPIFHNGAG